MLQAFEMLPPWPKLVVLQTAPILSKAHLFSNPTIHYYSPEGEPVGPSADSQTVSQSELCSARQ